MTAVSIDSDYRSTSEAGLIDRVARRMLVKVLSRLEAGAIEIQECGSTLHFGPADAGLSARIVVLDSGFWSDVAFGGTLGAGESYFEGHWECDRIADLVRILCRDRSVMETLDRGPVSIRAPLRRLVHWWHRNSRHQARRNIAAHYDLSDALFATFLDRNWQYSSAILPEPGADLDRAQEHKMALLCERLQARSDHHILEIGSGWGALAIDLARRTGCRVTTTTISRNQCLAARRRVAEAGLADRVTVLESDYRDLQGSYDRLVSVEMIEAVGHQYLDTYFRTCSRLLRDDGLAVLQAITIADAEYERAVREVDFIKRHIFPGCCIPSVGALNRAAAAGHLTLIDYRDFAAHYAATLREWCRRFDEAEDEIESLGFDRKFRRAWRFYFAYCEGGFAERALGLGHFVFAKPGYRPPDHLALIDGVGPAQGGVG